MPVDPQPRRRTLISLTPLIDVVFILLVFFMLASNFLEWRAITLDAPKEAKGRAGGIEGSLLVEIRADGLRLSGLPLSLEELVGRVGEHLSKTPDRGIFIKPAPEISLQETIIVLDALTNAGASAISLIKAAGD